MSTKKNKAAERAERAAALLREQRARERRRNLITGGVVALVLAALVVVGILDQQGQRRRGQPRPGAATTASPSATRTRPTRWCIYEDFLCPVCGRARGAGRTTSWPSWPTTARCYVDYRPFNLLGRLGDYSARSASAFGVVLDESGPEVAKEFHDLLYADQPEEGDEPYPDADWLVEKAVEAGADEADVRPGIEEGATDFVQGGDGRRPRTPASAARPRSCSTASVFNGYGRRARWTAAAVTAS